MRNGEKESYLQRMRGGSQRVCKTNDLRIVQMRALQAIGDVVRLQGESE